MQILDIVSAQAFAANVGVGTAGGASSFKAFAKGHLATKKILKEGTSDFEDYRHGLLLESERLFFLGVSFYWRAFDQLMASSSPLALISLYYSSFFSAKSLLGIFGLWLDSPNLGIEPLTLRPGNISLAVRNRKHLGQLVNIGSTGQFQGPHRQFWKLYYESVGQIIPWVDPKISHVLRPYSGMNETWQIDSRNEINYDGYHALKLCKDFQENFDPRGISKDSLPGMLGPHLFAARDTLKITANFFVENKISPNSLDALGRPNQNRASKIRQLVFQASRRNFNREPMARGLAV